MPKPLKFAGKFKEGDHIRGYDFQPMAGRDDSYIEGVIEKADHVQDYYDCYKVKITRRVFGGKDVPEEVGGTGFIPHEVGFMEYDHRIIKV